MTGPALEALSATAVEYDPFAGDAIDRVVPTTEAQREIWLADQLGPEASLAYNESISLSMEGVLDVAALEQALAALLQRHDALRATFSGDGMHLLIAPRATIAIEQVDYSNVDASTRRQRLAEQRARAVETPFDLQRGPLLRAMLARTSAASHELVLCAHHLVCDGWSFGIVATELMALYEAARGGTPSSLPAAASFGDYARAQVEPGRVQTSEDDTQWWVRQFGAAPAPVLELPADRPRPARRRLESRREDLRIPAAEVDAVRKLGARNGASLFATLLATFGAMLARVSGQDDVVVGVPAAAQASEGEAPLVGHGVQLLPVRIAVPAAVEFTALLKDVRTRVLDAYEHQSCTFGTLLQKLAVPREGSRLPLVSVMFNLDRAIDSPQVSRGGLAVELRSNPRHFEMFDLFVNASQADGGLVLETQYNQSLFDAATVRAWLALYREALARLVADPQQRAIAAFAATEAERTQLARFNATGVAGPAERLEDLLLEHARSERVAVIHGDETLTHAALHARANGISRALSERGVGRGDFVGIHVERGVAMLAAVLGAIKSGATYMPMDPAFPAGRLAFMAEESGARFVLTDAATAATWGFPTAQPLVIESIAPSDDAPAAGGDPEDPAYVIYTSGTTGKPKGVLVPHRAVANFLRGMREEPGMRDDDTLVAVTTLSFDIAVLELLLPLTVGARVAIASREETMDPRRLSRLLSRHAATMMQATPATWRMLLDDGWSAPGPFKALVGGEALPVDLAQRLAAATTQLWNMYGPTETTVWSTCWRVERVDDGIRIGRPIANTQVHVLDDGGATCPIGVVGEICIAGAGVALGYLQRPELTAARFVDVPGEPGMRMYKTGDRGRWRADGTLQHLGRNDFQLKVRGFRIEPGEIEARLDTLPGIRGSVVIAREDRRGDVRLVAYVAADALPAEDALRAHLRAALPEYMVPQHVVRLASLPVLPNGKLDRSALPAPEAPVARDTTHTPPATSLERLVVAKMEEVLSLPGVALDDNFFSLGGHSLLAAQLAASLGRALERRIPLRTLFDAPTPRQLVAWLEGAGASATPATSAIPRRAGRATAPLSLMQHRVWFLEQLDPGRATYNTPSAHRLRGPFDAGAFRRAFAEVVRRQEVLRTSIDVVEGNPVQVIHCEAAPGLDEIEDLRAIPPVQREAELQARLDALAAMPFDLTEAPLFRARLFRTGEEEHVFYFGPHHIIWDGWSFDVFYREMAAAYEAFARGATPPLPELPVSYGDFAAWHRDWLQGEELAAELAHWKQQLAGTLPALELPVDRPRPAEMSGKGDSLRVRVDAARVEAARQLGRDTDATLFMVLLAAYVLTLHQATGQREIVVGVPVRGRQVPELESIMGFFVNALPLRLCIDPDAPFAALLAQVRDRAIDAFKHPEVPFEQLVRELKVPRDRTRFPVYQALFSFQDARGRQRRWGPLGHEMVHVMQPGIAEDLSLWLMERADGIEGGLAWNADILEGGSAELLCDRFVAALDFALSQGERPLRALALAPDESRRLEAWNATQRPYDTAATVHALVSRQCAATPQRIAATSGTQSITYAELDSTSNRLAHALRGRGARRGARVGLCLERGTDLLAAMLGVLKSGACYVPLDPAFPAERLEYMANDAGLACVVGDASLASALPAWPVEKTLRIDDRNSWMPQPDAALADDGSAARAGDCAYVIYTSGTTGKPKGVQIPHRAVANFLASMQAEPGLAADDRLVAVTTTLSFDIAVLELLLPLTAGAQVAIAQRDEAADPRTLMALLGKAHATVMQATPATWRMLLDAGWHAPARFRALVGGEALSADLAQRLHDAGVADLWNMYGPTETTVWSTCWRVQDPGAGIRIGRPIANTLVHVLDENGRGCPIGVAGEIWIGGDGVMIGYLHQPGLDRERLREDPFAGRPGARMYRTGDRGRWRHDGLVEHLGRNDFQVKVRGFRIELGEIESKLGEHPAVSQAVALAREDTPGDVRLAAYYVPRGADPGAEALRAHLRAFLPPYMVPQHFVALASVPLLPNGKVDRASLPRPDATTTRAALAPSRNRTPTTESEKALAQIWAGLLKVDDIGTDDNFFDLGGHSLLGMQAILAMEQKTGRRIERNRFVFETLGQIARGYDDAPLAAPAKSGLRGLLGGLIGRK